MAPICPIYLAANRMGRTDISLSHRWSWTFDRSFFSSAISDPDSLVPKPGSTLFGQVLVLCGVSRGFSGGRGGGGGGGGGWKNGGGGGGLQSPQETDGMVVVVVVAVVVVVGPFGFWWGRKQLWCSFCGRISHPKWC